MQVIIRWPFRRLITSFPSAIDDGEEKLRVDVRNARGRLVNGSQVGVVGHYPEK